MIGVVTCHFAGGQCEAGRDHRIFAEDRKFLGDIADIAIQFEKLGDFRMRTAAEATAVIEEFDDGHIAFGIASHPGIAVVEDRIGVVFDQRHIALCLFSSLTLLKHLNRFHDHFRILQQIRADLCAKGSTFGIRHVVEIKISSLNAGCQKQGGERRGEAGFRHVGLQSSGSAPRGALSST
jgi:hypothetical protein